MKRVDLAAVKVWRIGNLIFTCILILLFAALVIMKNLFLSWLPVVFLYIFVALIILQILWFVWLEPEIAFRTHRYQIGETELTTLSGVLIKKKTIIPFVRIQNVETHIGPIMKRFNLKSVEVTTAGGGTHIELINAEEAEDIKRGIDDAVAALERRQQ